MLRNLHLKNVGPSPEMEMSPAPHLNIITGDNGLGKSFLLDVIWWALTRRWPHDINHDITSGYPARPRDPKEKATIEFTIESRNSRLISYESRYDPRDQAWIGKSGRPWNPGLVIYAHADGGFSVWDPARNYWKTKGNIDIQERLPGYVFSERQVWDGLDVEIGGKAVVVCNGLLRDWATWIRENGDFADSMAAVLSRLSPENETIGVGPLTRPFSLDDARDIPSIRTSYSDAVPIVHASSGVRRILGLAYILLWSYNEHHRAAELIGERTTSRVVMLVDEIESHLHPLWQRSILRSILGLVEELHTAGGEKPGIQLITATHSPLILASAEPLFRDDRDAWFDLDIDREEKIVKLQRRTFVRKGTAGRWLMSEAFDLSSEGRSLEAEAAIKKADALFDRRRSGEAIPATEWISVDGELAKLLADGDRYLVRWRAALDEIRGN